MSYETEDMQFALFKNDRKRTDKDADYNGSGRVSGEDVWANAWMNTSQKDGRKYLKVRLKAKVEKQEPVTLTKGGFGTAIDDDIAF